MTRHSSPSKWERSDLLIGLIAKSEEWELRRALFALIYDIGALPSFTSNLAEYEPDDAQSQLGMTRVRQAIEEITATA